MWCANCHADVAAEVTLDNRRVRCVACGRELGSSQGGPAVAKTQEARELLQRWANERLLDPYGPVLKGASAEGVTPRDEQTADRAASPPVPSPHSRDTADDTGGFARDGDADASHTGPKRIRGASDSTHQIRIDHPHPSKAFAEPVEEPPRTTGAESSAESPPTTPSHKLSSERHIAAQQAQSEIDSGTFAQTTTRVHAGHPPNLSGPHFDVPTAAAPEPVRKTNWMAFGGQLLAYLGIGGLTVGTTLVLWGYFGGPESYLSTGWLMTTAGQMLLFLGIVTLVSGGMEQMTEEVARRIDELRERVIGLEQVTHGRHLSPRPEGPRPEGGSSSPSGASNPDSSPPAPEESPSTKTGHVVHP